MGLLKCRGLKGRKPLKLSSGPSFRAFLGWKEQQAVDPFRDAKGNPVPFSCVLIDSGYSPDAAYEFVRQVGEPYRPAKGSSNFHPGQKSLTRRVGNHWFATPQNGRVWLYTLDPDHWKTRRSPSLYVRPLDENNRP